MRSATSRLPVRPCRFLSARAGIGLKPEHFRERYPLSIHGVGLSSGGDALRRMDNRVATCLPGRLDHRPFTSIVVLRMLFQRVPAFNYALAMSGVRLRPCLTGALLGVALPSLFYGLFFDYPAKALKLL